MDRNGVVVYTDDKVVSRRGQSRGQSACFIGYPRSMITDNCTVGPVCLADSEHEYTVHTQSAVYILSCWFDNTPFDRRQTTRELPGTLYLVILGEVKSGKQNLREGLGGGRRTHEIACRSR